MAAICTTLWETSGRSTGVLDRELRVLTSAAAEEAVTFLQDGDAGRTGRTGAGRRDADRDPGN